MLGLPILDVAIGLIFVYLLFSLLVSAATEYLASIFRWRARMLWDGIQKLIGDPKAVRQLYDHPLIKALCQDSLLDRFVRHPAVSVLGGALKKKQATGNDETSTNGQKVNHRISYIPSRVFALALVDLVVSPPDRHQALGVSRETLVKRVRQELQEAPSTQAGRASKSPDYLRALAPLLDSAGEDVEKFMKSIEEWFNSAMDRISGWYKRWAQYVALGLALLITVWANVDTIAIGNALWTDPSLRAAVVAQAEAYAKQAQQESKTPATTAPGASTPGSTVLTPEQQLQATLTQMERLKIPLRWTDDDRANLFGAFGRHALGWLLTILAISLGAPFWFDLLKRFISIRAAGKAPVPSEEKA